MNRAKKGMPSRTQHGAAAVEFALISGLLFTVLFGILQYGLYFNDALNVRQGVREAARQGVVENFGPTGSGCTSGASSAQLACYTKQQVGTGAGTVYVRITAPNTWAKTNPLVVCAAVKSIGSNGILPMPNGGYVMSKTQLSIEQTAKNAVTAWTDWTQDTLPSGVTWPTGC